MSEGRPAAADPGAIEAGTPVPPFVRESRRDGSPFTLYEHSPWQERFPGLACGLTAGVPDSDFGAGTASPAARFLEAHAGLAAQIGFQREATVRQVHGARIACVDGPTRSRGELGAAARRRLDPEGAWLLVAGRADGLVTRATGVLLTITVADCVPVYLVDPISRVLGLFHAGWRGAAAGVLERGVERAVEAGGDPEAIYLHLGPAICEACYPVGAEVSEALGVPGSATVDLRGVLAERARGLGLAAAHLSRSVWCTCCDRDRFHSHRGMGELAGRMAAFLGWRDAGLG